MPLSLSLTSLIDPVLPRILRRMPPAKCYAVFVFSALVERMLKLSGPSYHSQISDLLQSGVNSEEELREWLEIRFAQARISSRSFDMARKQADLQLQEGVWVASWCGASPPSDGPLYCPQVVFGKGNPEVDTAWAAIFNSRKPKLISPRAEWLQVLRTMLDFIAAHNLGFASSLGTTSYDLVTAACHQLGTALLLVLSTPLESIGNPKDSLLPDAASFPKLVLTCMARDLKCSKAVSMVCRDRLLACVSDLHCVLEVRSEGNLLKILEKQQKDQPRLQWIIRPASETAGNSGNLKLLHSFPQTAIGFSDLELAAPTGPQKKERPPRHSLKLLHMREIKWHEYLYHYTRSCPGPWPNQSYRDYLLGLLNDELLSGHTALETLIRILLEGRIRAGSKIVRGDQAVISWTSRSPLELGAVRRWNPALIRWTFEPYGLAIRREVLRKRGAKPSIYAKSAVYQQLQRQELYRFQLHDPPHCSWKNEREWRLLYDLMLGEITPDQGFAFVPAASDVKELEKVIACALPIVVLGS
jgi:hypothetical protein